MPTGVYSRTTKYRRKMAESSWNHQHKKKKIWDVKNMKSNEIKEKELQLQYQIEELQKQQQQALIDEGKAYTCKKCKTFVDKEKISPVPLEMGLCSNCFNRKWNDDKKQEILKKLKFAKIVDIELASVYDIEKITVYKNGMLYDLKPREIDRGFSDEPAIIIDHEYKDDKQHDLMEEPEMEAKPWEKKRAEKKLI